MTRTSPPLSVLSSERSHPLTVFGDPTHPGDKVSTSDERSQQSVNRFHKTPRRPMHRLGVECSLPWPSVLGYRPFISFTSSGNKTGMERSRQPPPIFTCIALISATHDIRVLRFAETRSTCTCVTRATRLRLNTKQRAHLSNTFRESALISAVQSRVRPRFSRALYSSAESPNILQIIFVLFSRLYFLVHCLIFVCLFQINV